jgi:hypothetical protein
MSRDSLSKVLAACAIGLFATGHVLPITKVVPQPVKPDATDLVWPLPTVRGSSGWDIASNIVISDFYMLGVKAYVDGLDGQDCLWLLGDLFPLLFWLGVTGFFVTAHSRPRIAGIIAAFSGLCGAASLVIAEWDILSEIELGFGAGYFVWLASMGLLFAAGFCKLIAAGQRTVT